MTNFKNILKKRWFRLLLTIVCVGLVFGLLFFIMSEVREKSDDKKSVQATELYNQGQEALSNRNFQESIDKLLLADKDRPNDFNTVYSLALAYYGLKDYTNAEKYYSLASESSKANKSSIATIYNNLGNIYRDSNQIDKAEAAYKKAIGLDPHMTFPYMNLAVMYHSSEKNDQALAILNQGISAIPSASDLVSLLKKYSK